MDEDSKAGRDALALVQAAWNEAAGRWDPDAFADLYTDDALFYGGRPDHSVGAAAIRGYFASYHDVIETGALELVEQHVVRLAPACFLAQGFGYFSSVLRGKGASRSRLRTTWIIVRQDGRWKIRQHHFSAPPDAPPI